ncbi:DUF4956 domain-containing protein [Nocardioides sp. IC4_145]|uniref:DUF4956 domain-containing protein n=1 Tax=Nocardioides sp. IC4_145 TaxID=2714037 RepID=UPI00140C1443|nr:DUF4956 domain-containing protein [Nocardioides sp. IC4_145]NHC25244.1 DUF4956 domain-containing protein [Nocardioides sp. IC4_145]
MILSTHALPIACDLVAITLVVALYFRRHQRRDLLLAYVALNVGVLSATAMLASASVGAGLGLGLFGILSIIRLRSDSITQEEIAYYFVALVLGLLAGVAAGPAYLVPLLIGLLVAVVYVADHPRLYARSRRMLLTLDAAFPDESLLRVHVEARLGADVQHLIVQEVDFVRDLTIVDVRYRTRPAQGVHAASGADVPSSRDLPVPSLGSPVARTEIVDLVSRNGAALRPERP